MLKKLTKKLMHFLSKLTMEQEDVVGIDITPSCIRLAQLDGKDDKWTLTKLGYKYIEDDQGLLSVKEQSGQYVNKLVQLTSASKITTTNAAVSIPVSSAIIKVVTLPLMTEEELQEAVDTNSLWENAVQLADDLDEYSIFWQTLKRDTNANQMDLLFVASKLDDIDHYLNIVREAGLKPVVVDVRCFAIRNALELRKDLTKTKLPIAIVEFGAYENYILILHGDAPFISDIYLSDKDRNLILSQNVDEEALKRVTDRFCMQITQMLSSYQSKYKIQPIESLLFSSSIPVINHTIDHIQNALPNISVDIFNSLKNVKVPANLKEKFKAEPNRSVFSSVMGLATRKLDVFGYYEYVTGTNNINLLPNREGVKSQEKMKFLTRWLVVIFIICAVAFGAWSFMEGQAETEELDQQLVEYTDLEMERDTQQAILSDLVGKKRELDGMLEASKNLRSNQGFMYSVLLSVNASVPAGVALSSIEYEGDGVVTIKGLSLNDQNILQFIETISRSNVIEKSSLLAMAVEKINGRSFKTFSVRCLLAEQKSSVGQEGSNGN